MWKHLLWSLGLLWAGAVQAQIVPDASLGSERSSVVPRALGGESISGGALRGSNLFHSFTQFNVGNGAQVYFANPTGVQTILTRVTGKTASTINGVLGVDGSANLFLLNPNGIVFGENARLDLRGSFVATTANAIGFGTQGSFSATNPTAPPLLTVQPSAFLFNQLKSAPIQSNARNLKVGDGQSLVLLGGDVLLDNSDLSAANTIGGQIELGGLATPGKVDLAIEGNSFRLGFPTDILRGDVTLTNGSFVDVRSATGGSVAVHARNLTVSNGSILAAGIIGTVNGQAGDVTLDSTAAIEVKQSSYIGNNVYANARGYGGDIIIKTGSMLVQGGSQINVSTSGRGNAGNVIIQANESVVFDGVSSNNIPSAVFNSVESGAEGNGGTITLTAGSLALLNGAQWVANVRGKGNAGNINVQTTGDVFLQPDVFGSSTIIASQVDAGGVGNGGNISIRANSVSLRDGAEISTSTGGRGNAGNITIQAKDTVALAGTSIGITFDESSTASDASMFDGISFYDISSAVSSNVDRGAIGNGGNITIKANSISLRDGAQIDAFTNSRGNAGNVTLQANDAVVFDGTNLNSNPSGASTGVASGAIGNGGIVTIIAGSLSLLNGGQLSASVLGVSDSFTAGQGNSGGVNLNVRDAITIKGQSNDRSSGIFSSLGDSATGQGGNINITTGSLNIRDTGTVVATTSGKGNAGNVTIQAKDDVVIDGSTGDNFNPTGIFSDVGFFSEVGSGGTITLTAGSLSLLNGGQLVATAAGVRGNGGEINLNVRDAITIKGQSNSEYIDIFEIIAGYGTNSGIFSRLGGFSAGRGGDINITAGSLSISDNGQLLAITDGKGNAGNVNIRARNQVMLDGGSNSTRTTIATAVQSGSTGRGGNIQITSGSLALNNNAQLFASTEGQGDAGSISIQTGEMALRSNSNVTPSIISTEVGKGGTGRGGDIAVRASSLLLDRSRITSQTVNNNGGNIDLRINNPLVLRRGSAISSTAGTAQSGGNGGNITIDAGTIVTVPNEGSFISANAFSGNGGNVNITTQSIFGFERSSQLDSISRITASSQLGVQGQVTINQPQVQPRPGAIVLPTTPIPGNQIAQSCPRNNPSKPLGSFVVSGRGSAPTSPIAPLSGSSPLSPLATLDSRSNTSTAGVSSSPTEIREAQGWVKTSEGKVVLVAQTIATLQPPLGACPVR